MTETLLALVPLYGLWLIALATFLSCLAAPVPSSLLMIVAGAFAASGDLSLTAIVFAAFLGAVLGDQAGFSLGRSGSGFLEKFMNISPRRQAIFNHARDFSETRGGLGVFLSRWLFSPLGPYVNFIGGATGFSWAGFTMWSAAGEAVWVSIYTGLGYAFGGEIQMISDFVSNITGLLATGAVALGLGRFVFR